MMHLLALAGSILGLGFLAFAAERVREDLCGRQPDARALRWLRLSSAIVLAAVLALLVWWQGWSLGLVMFSGHTSLAAGAVLCCLILHARLRRQGEGRRD